MNAPTDPADFNGPDLDTRAAAYRTIAAALAWLQARADAPPALAELAAHAGLSESHLQRLFSHWAGISPKRFLQHLARDKARAALLAGDDLVTASFAAGLSGPGRLHDLMVNCEAATPGEIKSGGAGLAIRWGVAVTPFGPAFLAASGRGLMKLSFLESDIAAADHAEASSAAAALRELQNDWPAASLLQDAAAATTLAQRIFTAYREPQPLPLFIKGTQFQLKVWEALLTIPEGRLVTYGALAQRLGQPGASRAVGSAVGANPVALLIPCHRVIRASGALGGYRWGEGRKRLLVTAEIARHAPDTA